MVQAPDRQHWGPVHPGVWAAVLQHPHVPGPPDGERLVDSAWRRLKKDSVDAALHGPPLAAHRVYFSERLEGVGPADGQARGQCAGLRGPTRGSARFEGASRILLSEERDSGDKVALTAGGGRQAVGAHHCLAGRAGGADKALPGDGGDVPGHPAATQPQKP